MCSSSNCFWLPLIQTSLLQPYAQICPDPENYSGSVSHIYILPGSTQVYQHPPRYIWGPILAFYPFICFDLFVEKMPSVISQLADTLLPLFPSHPQASTHALQKERDPLWYYVPPVNQPIVMRPFLFNVGLLIPLFSRNI